MAPSKTMKDRENFPVFFQLLIFNSQHLPHHFFNEDHIFGAPPFIQKLSNTRKSGGRGRLETPIMNDGEGWGGEGPRLH